MKLTLSNRRLQTIQKAIFLLGNLQSGLVQNGTKDGRPTFSKDPTAKIRLNAKFSYALRRNHGKIESALSAFYKTKEERLKIHSEDGKINLEEEFIRVEGSEPQPNTARDAAIKDVETLLDEQVEVDLHMVSENEFQLDQNNIPIQLLNDIKEFTIDPNEEAAKEPRLEVVKK